MLIGGSLRYEDITGQDRVLTEITTSNQSSRVDKLGWVFTRTITHNTSYS